MLFTAIGFQKPVLTSDDMNPEVFAAYSIGETFPSGDMDALRKTLERFINEYDVRAPQWHKALSDAAAVYAPSRFAVRIAAVAAGEDEDGEPI